MMLQLQKIVSVMLMTMLVLLPLLPTQVHASSISGNPAISGFQPASQGGDAGTGSPQSTGARSGAYQTDTFTGSATYSYPIELPPYRNGLTPQLSLQYSSSNTATDSIAGYGWSLSWASIHRRQEGGIENLYNSNTFSANIFGMSGELTPYALTDSTHGEYRFSEESGPYWRVFYNVNNTWTALNQDGTTFTFGGTSISRQTDPANASHVYSWGITSIEDANTGLVTFNYITNGNRVYPYAITYGPVSVTLSYDTRPDPTTHYDAGFAVATTMRLHSVTVDINSAVSSGEYRLWTLGYGAGDNGTRSLLSTVYESGVSPEGVETELPTVDFSYTDSGSRGFTPSGATFPTTFTDPNGQDNGFRVLDVNGDGYDDLIQAYVEHYINPNIYTLIDSVYINNHTPALIYDASYSFPEGLVMVPMNYSDSTDLLVIMNLVDINNDGLTDLTEGNNFEYTSTAVYLNEDGTFNDTSAWPNAANLAPYTPNGTDLGRRFVDVNGDGYPDMILSSENNSLYSTAWITETMLNNGTAENLQSSALWHAPMAFEWNWYQSEGWERGVRFADVNGDGLQDILWAWADFHDITTLADEQWYANAVYLNNGNGGWDLAPSWTIPQAFVYSRTGAGLPPSIAANPQLNVSMPDEGGVDAGVRLMDMNADGLVDIVKGDGYWQYIESVLQSSMSLTVDYPTHEVYLNNGVNGWNLSTTSNTIPTFTNGWASDTSHRYGDADADGLTDVFSDATNVGGDNIYLNSATPADLLENITTTKDGEMSIAYEPASADGSEMPYTSTVVASVTTDDGFGDTHTTNYTYTGGDLVKYDTYKTEFAGFAEVTTTTESGTSVTAYDQGLTDYGKKGRVIRSQVYSGSGVLLKQYDTTWETVSLGPNRNFTYASQSVQLDYEGTASHRDTAVQYTYDLTTGQVTQTQELGEVDAEPSGEEYEIPSPTTLEEEGLEGYYQFTEGPPSTFQSMLPSATIADSSGHGRNLTSQGNAYWAPGYTNSSIRIIADDQYAEHCSTNGALNLGPVYTVSAWIMPTSLSGLKVIAAKYDSQRSDGLGKSWRLMLDGSQLRWQTSTNTTTIQTLSGSSVTLDQWSHVAVVSDGTTVRTYVNGVMGASVATAVDPYNSVTCVVLGVEKQDENPSNADSYEFNGMIDEVRIYNNRAYAPIADIMDTDLTDDITPQPIIAETESVITNTLPGDERTTTIAYTVDTANWIVRPDLVTLAGFDSAVVAKADSNYDSNGNLVSQSQWLNTNNTWMTTLYTVNSAGLPTTVTNPRGHSSTIQYDAAYTIFPTTITNALGQVSTQTYNYLTGQVTSSTDPNSRTSSYIYDGIGRLLTASVPHPTTGIPTPLTTYTYDDASFPSSVSTASTINSVTLESRTYMDGFGRSVQSWQANEGPGQTVTDFWYNDQGLTSQATLPYASTSSSWTGRQSSQPSVTTLYDTLGRAVAVTSPVGTSYTSYQPWIVATTDANGHLTEYGYNGYGHMTTVDEHFGPNEYTTFYSYNALDQMHQKLDVYGNVQHTTADSLGRVVSQSTLHVPGDPGVGIWTYQYDVNGNLLQRTDPSSRTTSWTYDALDRTVNEDWYNNGTPDVVSTYDTAPNGVGRLAQVAMDGVTTSFEYDAQGNTVEETRVIDADTYTTAWQYDLGGRVTHMTYPDNAMTVDYTYNTAGMIETIMKDGTEPIIENMNYAATGQANVIEYGNGVTTTNTFDPLENYRLTSTVTTGTYEDNPDVDGDGLNFAQEQLYGTDPNDPDTDGDTLNDYAEVFTYSTNPTLSDTDADGFSDPVELTQGTDPLAVDTTVYNNNTTAFPVTYNTIDNVALNKPVVSLIPEDPTYSIALGYEADNLTDGNTSNLAYPAFQQFDYVIDLEGAFPLETVLLQWNEFGIGEDDNPATPTFITSWELTGTLPSGDEIVLAAEDSPQAFYSLVELGDFLQTLNFTELEIHAWSTVNWIGMFELSAFTPFVDTDNDALSTYQETELYSTNPELFDTNGDGVPDSLVSRTLTLTPYSPNPTSNTTLTWNGTAEITPINSTAAVSLVGVEYSVSGDASVPWTTATAADGAFDENNEPYTVTLGPLLDGSYNLEVRLITSIATNNYTTNNLNNVVTIDTDADNDGVPNASDSCADTAPIAAADTVNSDGCALSQLDTDGDGLNDYEELVVYSTDPTLADTDGDTLTDYDEVVVYNTNPLLQDTDSDGLTDSIEIQEFETDPNDWDTDDDTVSDGDEVNIYGTDPLEWDNFVAEDSDGDQLSDEFELANGTDPNDWDTDDNGMPDSVLGVGNILYAYSPDPTTNTDLSYTGMASLTYPFFSFAPPGMYVSGVEFQLETGSSAASAWYPASPTDGTWDSSTEDYQFNTGPLTPGTHVVATKVYVTVGSITFVAAQHSDEVTITAEESISYADPDDEAPWWMRLTARPAMATVTGDIQHNTYTYDAVGNITAINDTSITPTEKSVTYTYDDYYRLMNATTTGYSQGDYSVSYQYDLIGNLTYKSDAGTLTYAGTGNPTPHAVTAVNGTPYTYDTNGNLTSDGEHTYTFDIRDRMVSSGSWTFEYDHTGQRVTSTNASTGDTTQYVNSFVESRPDGMVYYIYAGGERVAQVVDGQTYYYHKDHLQGTALVTNEAGVVTFISDYTPYGGTSYSVSYGPDVAYTYGGKEFNEDIGVTYFGARYYNPTIGRFISMDPVSQPAAVPQLHNEYSYSANSPILFTDPTGGAAKKFNTDKYSPYSLTKKIELYTSYIRNKFGSTDAAAMQSTIIKIAVQHQMASAQLGIAPFGSPLNTYQFRPVQSFHNKAPGYGYPSNRHPGVDINYNFSGALPTVFATISGKATAYFAESNVHIDYKKDKNGNIIESKEHSVTGNAMHGGADPLGLGNYVKIEGSNFRVFFGHLSQVLIPTGESVEVTYGMAIGIMGTTGNSEGNHVHYQVEYKDASGNWSYVDPENYGLFFDLDGNALAIEQKWKYDKQ